MNICKVKKGDMIEFSSGNTNERFEVLNVDELLKDFYQISFAGKDKFEVEIFYKNGQNCNNENYAQINRIFKKKANKCHQVKILTM